MTFKQHIQTLLVSRDTRDAKVIMGLIAFLLGIVSLAKPDTLDKTMLVALDSSVWSALFFTYSSLIFSNIKHAKTDAYPETCLGFFIWSIVATSICITAKSITILSVPYIVLAVLSWWILIRVGIKNG